MFSGSVCRVCLAGNVKLYPIEDIPLLNIYERLTNTHFHKNERPTAFCPFCYQKLLKCYTFFTMAWKAENLFDQMLLQGVQEFVTKLKLGVTRHMTVAPMQSLTIDSSTANRTPKETIKEEPKPIVKDENVIIVKCEAVCRVCLTGNLKLNPMDSIPLMDVYKKLTNTQFNSEDGRPRAMCPFCYQKLLKCYTFSKIARRSEKLFNQLLLNGLKEITDELVTQLTLRVKQNMSVTHLQSISIDSTWRHLVTVKEEPISIQKEEYAKDNLTEDSGIRTKCIKKESITIQLPGICTICGKIYKTEKILKRHMKVHEPKEKHTCRVCSKELMHKHSLTKHMKIHSDDREFVCTVCNKQFRHIQHLKPHMRIHTGEKPYPCTVCQKRFNEKSHLTRHMVLHTGGKDSEPRERLFACKECNKKFFILPNLKRHMRIHTQEKPFLCAVCDKRYQTKYNLALHISSEHNRVKPPLACNLCDKRFHYRSQLLNHLRRHNGVNTNKKESKTFMCHVCNEHCIRKKNLIIHMRLLHPGKKLYECNDCGKQFFKKDHLIRHLSSHKGKQYSCDLCCTRFIYKDSIIGHMRIHTGETPHVCKICNKKFTQKKNLQSHIEKTHKPKSESDSE